MQSLTPPLALRSSGSVTAPVHERTAASHLVSAMADPGWAVQTQLLNLLKAKTTVVGDDMQSIYGFRGAYAGALQDFRDLYTHPDILHTLSINYRQALAWLLLLLLLLLLPSSFDARHERGVRLG